MRPLIASILIWICYASAPGQKYLIIEKAGNPRTEKIALYDEVKFSLKDDDKGWYVRQLFDLNADGQMALLGDTWIHVEDISRMYMKRKRKAPMILGTALQGGGASMLLGDVYATLRSRQEYTEGGMEVGAINMAAGTALKALWSPIKYRFGKRKRLKVIDITFRSSDKT